MEQFEEYIENPIKLSVLFLIEILMSCWIYSFKNSSEIASIRHQNLGALREAFEIVQVDGYYAHLFIGLVWAIILLFLIVLGFKRRKYIAALIYIVFLIIFWVIFRDPIVTTFLTISIASGLILLSMDS
ncbi:hypothetical protein [Streptococcus merionis]|uniref:hypothetical protein n=1 Tax=Streptococcus merionis TaxID=400065 RepID=UPI0026F23A32|nr:hypothetical protein [Streptococcus merionis]